MIFSRLMCARWRLRCSVSGVTSRWIFGHLLCVLPSFSFVCCGSHRQSQRDAASKRRVKGHLERQGCNCPAMLGCATDPPPEASVSSRARADGSSTASIQLVVRYNKHPVTPLSSCQESLYPVKQRGAASAPRRIPPVARTFRKTLTYLRTSSSLVRLNSFRILEARLGPRSRGLLSSVRPGTSDSPVLQRGQSWF